MAPHLRRSLLARSLLLAAVVTAPGCQDSSAVYALIGPEGGSVAIPDGPTLVIPPGALVTTRQIIIRPIEADLSKGSFKQSGGAFRLEPTDLDLKVPAELTFEGDQPAMPTILWRRGEGRVVSHAAADDRALAYIGGLGTVALAAGGELAGSVDEPTLARVPTEVDYTKPFVDTATIKVTPKGTQLIDIGLTVYDPMGMSNRPLNGDGSRYCGFKFASVQGGSITGGCSGGLATGSLSINSTQVAVDASPFLLGKVDNAMLVEVQVGSGDLAHSLGFFPFKTGPCYLESCSGHGVCDDSSGAAQCMCADGYAPGEGLVCNCVPQCEGRNCGGNGCGGDCGSCGPDSQCNFDIGQCEGMPPPMSTGPDTTGPMTTGPDTTTGDSTSTTGDGSTSGSSSGDMSSGSSG